MAADTGIPLLPPAEAIDFFRQKGFKIGFAWQDVWQEEHAKAFTVAKAMSRDVLETIRKGVDDALANGETFAQFRAKLTPLLQAKGWWGKASMIDPATGLAKTVQLGSPRRLKIIYDMNMRMARAAGRWAKIQRTKDSFPYLRYTAVMDERTRPEHVEWHGTILPVDDPWWDTHYPPCGWNCRCTVIQLDAAMIAGRGWEISDGPPPAGSPSEYQNPRTGEVSDVPAGIDPGFAYNVGKAWLGGLEPPPLLPAELPALEPGVAPGAAVPGSPEPASLLAANVGEAEAVDAFLAELGVGPRPAPGDIKERLARLARRRRGLAEAPPAALPDIVPPKPAIGQEAAEPLSLEPADIVPSDLAAAESADTLPGELGAGGRGEIVTDAGGWPLAIGPGWFEGIDGAANVPVGDRRRVLPLVARAIAAPLEIRWRWVIGADGTPMLFRRYLAKVDGLLIVVDVGKAGWRFATERDPGFDWARLATGTIAWSASQ